MQCLLPYNQSRNGQKPSQVLVVDDEPQNRMLLRDPLEARGYEVVEACSGEEALKCVAQTAPDVILLDVMMPEMDGFEVCRRLKKEQQTAPIPILMVTALSDRKERLLGIEAGANDFVNKPVDIQDILLRVGNAAYSKRLFDSVQVEREISDSLLNSILPCKVADRIKQGESSIADHHAEVTVLVADLVGFTRLAAHVSASEIVKLLDEVFTAFDTAAVNLGVEKIKTIGDGYMAAGGLNSPHPHHPELMVEFALQMRRAVTRVNELYETAIHTRIGISTGPLVAGVIGRKTLAYDLWGETVNLAFQLESCAAPGTIIVSDSTYEKAKDRFNFAPKTCYSKTGEALMAYQFEGCR